MSLKLDDIYLIYQKGWVFQLKFGAAVKRLNEQREAACIKQWAEEYPDFNHADPEQWRNSLSISSKIIRKTFLQNFQFKIFYKLIP